MTVIMGTLSDAATPTLQVSKSLFPLDPLLPLLLSWLPLYQVTLQVDSSSSSSIPPPFLSLTIHDGTETLHERNAILRTLCGRTLLCQMDQYPYCLLGGHAESVQALPESALAMAAMASFMSMADGIRNHNQDRNTQDHTQDTHNIFHSLNDLLQDRSFLLGSNCAKPTLADYDLYFALFPSIHSHNNSNTTIEDVWNQAITFGNVHRWMVAVQASIIDLSYRSIHRHEKKALLENLDFVHGSILSLVEQFNPPFPRTILDPVPIFDYGEDYENGSNVSLPSLMEQQPQDKQGRDTTVTTTTTTTTTTMKKNIHPSPMASVEGGITTGTTANACKKESLSEEEKKAAAEKRAKKKEEKVVKKKIGSVTTASDTTPTKEDPVVNIMALEIRIGKIVQVWPHESSEKLWCEKIDLGEEVGPRQVLSGLREFYTMEEMEGRMVLVLCNLKQRNLGGVPSHGMVLCASNADHTAVEFVVPPEGAVVGERVMFEGLTGDPEPENKVAKKKILELLAPDLKTNDDGVVVWKNVPSVTSAGPCVAVKGMKNAQVS